MRPQLLLLLLLIPSSLYAASPTTSDLLTIYQQALQNDPLLSANTASYQASKTLQAQAWSALLPQLNLSASDLRYYSDNVWSTTHTATLSLAQSLFNYSTWAGIKTAELQIQQSRAQHKAAEHHLMYRVAEAYFNILEAQDNYRFSLKHKQGMAKHLEYTEKRFKAGAAPITDKQEAKAKYDAAYATELSDKNKISIEVEKLNTLTGNTHHVQLHTLRSHIALDPPIPNKEEFWINQGLTHNPELRRYQIATILAKRNIAVQRSAYYPNLDLQASFLTTRTKSNGATLTNSPIDSATLTLNIPLFSGGSVAAKTRQAGYQLHEAQAQYEGQLRHLISQTRNNFRQVLTQIQIIKAHEQAVLSRKSALHSTEVAYKAGTRTLAMVLDAETDLFSAKKDLAKARYNYLLTLLKLKQVAGTIAMNDLITLNQALTP
jgi:outer membrane protein